MLRALRPCMLLLLACLPITASAAHAVSATDPAGDQWDSTLLDVCDDPALDLVSLDAAHAADEVVVSAGVADASAAPSCGPLAASRGRHAVSLVVALAADPSQYVAVRQTREVSGAGAYCLVAHDDQSYASACRAAAAGDDLLAADIPLSGTLVNDFSTVSWDFRGRQVVVSALTSGHAHVSSLSTMVWDDASTPAFVA